MKRKVKEEEEEGEKTKGGGRRGKIDDGLRFLRKTCTRGSYESYDLH